MKHAIAVALVLGFPLAACDGPAEPPTPKAEEPAQQAPEPAPTLFDSQIKTLEKAKEVGGELQNAEAARQQQIEQATQ